MNLFLLTFKSGKNNKGEKQVGKQNHDKADTIIAKCQLYAGEVHQAGGITYCVC